MSSYKRSIIFISSIITEKYIIFGVFFVVSQRVDNNWKRGKCKHQSYGKIEGKGKFLFSLL